MCNRLFFVSQTTTLALEVSGFKVSGFRLALPLAGEKIWVQLVLYFCLNSIIKPKAAPTGNLKP